MSVSLKLSNVSKSFGEAKIIQNLNLDIQKMKDMQLLGQMEQESLPYSI